MAAAAVGGASLGRPDLVRLRIRIGRDDHAVDHAEDRRGGADAERERQQRHQHGHRAPTERAERVAQILSQRFQPAAHDTLLPGNAGLDGAPDRIVGSFGAARNFSSRSHAERQFATAGLQQVAGRRYARQSAREVLKSSPAWHNARRIPRPAPHRGPTPDRSPSARSAGRPGRSPADAGPARSRPCPEARCRARRRSESAFDAAASASGPFAAVTTSCPAASRADCSISLASRLSSTSRIRCRGVPANR